MCSDRQTGLGSAPADLTFSPPTLTGTESGSSAAESGWRISAMGFCPELARPLGAPTLILQEAGRRGRVTGVKAVRFSAADNGERRQREAFFSVRGLLSWDVTPAGWSQLSADLHCAAPDVKLHEPGCKQTRHVTIDMLKIVSWEDHWLVSETTMLSFSKLV